MKRWMLYALLVWAAVGCQRSDLENHADGELVEVSLNLSMEYFDQVGKTALPPHTNDHGAITATVEPQPLSKADTESQVRNLWVFQFNGMADGATLVHKEYVADYATTPSVHMIRSSVNHRVALVANSFDPKLGDNFSIGTTTWATVAGSTKIVEDQNSVVTDVLGDKYIPMSGSQAVTVTEGMTVSIPVTRTVVKVVVDLLVGADLNTTALSYRMCNVPNQTAWFPDWTTPVWPVSPVIDYPAGSQTGFSTSQTKQMVFWVPINRRGTVAANLSGLTRVTNAPANATYLKLGAPAVVYTIHLGADFLTDYNLRGNTVYNYTLWLRTDPLGTDSRVNSNPPIGALSQTPAGNVSAEGATVTVLSLLSASAINWTATLSNSVGFTVSAYRGSGPTREVDVIVSPNLTITKRSTTLTATGSGASSAIVITQNPASVTYNSPTQTTPASSLATSATFTIKGTTGLVCTVAKTGGDAAFSAPNPASITCNGQDQEVTVTFPVHTSGTALRQATYSVTVTGAPTLNLSNIKVRQTFGPGTGPAKGQIGYITQGIDADGIDAPAGLMYVGVLGGYVGSAYTKDLYVEPRGANPTSLNPGTQTDTQLDWGYANQTAAASDERIGLSNTLSLLVSPAAGFCRDKQAAGAPWASMFYLPAVDQLEKLLDAIKLLTLPSTQTFEVGNYWTSTQINATQAHHVSTHTRLRGQSFKTAPYYVRCVYELPRP